MLLPSPEHLCLVTEGKGKYFLSPWPQADPGPSNQPLHPSAGILDVPDVVTHTSGVPLCSFPISPVPHVPHLSPEGNLDSSDGAWG